MEKYLPVSVSSLKVTKNVQEFMSRYIRNIGMST
jgi:hypothetical protein